MIFLGVVMRREEVHPLHFDCTDRTGVCPQSHLPFSRRFMHIAGDNLRSQPKLK
jgi:hypothetical protein